MESNKTNQGLLGQKGTKMYVVGMECRKPIEETVCKTVSYSSENKKRVKEDKCTAKCSRESSIKKHLAANCLLAAKS